MGPLFDTIIDHGVTDVVFCGSIMESDYFRKVVLELMTPKELYTYCEERRNFFKAKYIEKLDKKMFMFELTTLTTGPSTLVHGCNCMLTSSETDGPNNFFLFESI